MGSHTKSSFPHYYFSGSNSLLYACTCVYLLSVHLCMLIVYMCVSRMHMCVCYVCMFICGYHSLDEFVLKNFFSLARIKIEHMKYFTVV